MAKKREKKGGRRARASEFEKLVVATCLANALARSEYSVEAMMGTLEVQVEGWRKLARAAENALGR